MNNYERLEGMVAATFTPMDENGDVNLSVIEKYADWIASTPIKGVFVCGSIYKKRSFMRDNFDRRSSGMQCG